MQLAQFNRNLRYRYYGAPAAAFREGGLAEHCLGAGEASQALAVSAALTPYDFVSALTASDPQRDAQVAAEKAPNGMAPAAAATLMHHAELNAHSGDPLPRSTPRKFVKKIPKVVQHPICEVCNVLVIGAHGLENHVKGRKHKKNLEKLQGSITPKPENPPNGAVGASTVPASAAAVADGVIPAVQPKKNKRRVLEAGAAQGELEICTVSNVVQKIRKVVQPVTCEVCKIQCPTPGVLRDHETGNKHKKNLEKLQDSITPEPAKPPNGAVGASTVPAAAAAAVADGVIPAVQPKKVVPPVTCEVCKIQYPTPSALRDHETGNKHKKNLEKLQDSITPAKPPNGAVGASTVPAAVADGVIPAVQPKKNKKRRVLEAGAAQGELKICTVSNVVKKIRKVVQPVTCEVCKIQCPNPGVLRDHETGNKHKKNLKKLQDSITPEPAKPPNGVVGASTSPAAAVADGVIPAVEPEKNMSSSATGKGVATD